MPQEPDRITLTTLDKIFGRGQDLISLDLLDDIWGTERASGGVPQITVGGTEPLERRGAADIANQFGIAGGIPVRNVPTAPEMGRSVGTILSGAARAYTEPFRNPPTLTEQVPQIGINMPVPTEREGEYTFSPIAAPIDKASPVRRALAVTGNQLIQGLGEEAAAAGRSILNPQATASPAGWMAQFGGEPAYEPREPRGIATAIGEKLISGGTQMATAAGERAAVIPRPAPFTEVASAIKQGDFSKLPEWLAFNLGQAVGSTAAPIVGSIVGGAVAGPIGAGVGAFVPGYVLNKNEARQSLKNPGSGFQGVDDETAERLASTAAVPMAMLDALVPGHLVTKWFEGGARDLALKAVLKRIGIEMAGGATVEGLTEAAQSTIEQATTQWATGKPVDWSQVFEEGLVGSMAGLIFSGAGQISVEGRNQPPYIPPIETTRDVSIRRGMERATGRELTPEETRARQSAVRDPVTGEVSTSPLDVPTYERRGVPRPPDRTDLNRLAIPPVPEAELAAAEQRDVGRIELPPVPEVAPPIERLRRERTVEDIWVDIERAKASQLEAIGDAARPVEFQIADNFVRTVSRDPKGGFRVTNFTPYGPSGHTEHATMDDVLRELGSSTNVVEGVVQQWTQGDQWESFPTGGGFVETPPVEQITAEDVDRIFLPKPDLGSIERLIDAVLTPEAAPAASSPRVGPEITTSVVETPIRTYSVEVFKVGTRREDISTIELPHGSRIVSAKPNQQNMLRVETPDGARYWLDADEAIALKQRDQLRPYRRLTKAESAKKSAARVAQNLENYAQKSDDDVLDIYLRNEEQIDRENGVVARGIKRKRFDASHSYEFGPVQIEEPSEAAQNAMGRLVLAKDRFKAAQQELARRGITEEVIDAQREARLESAAIAAEAAGAEAERLEAEDQRKFEEEGYEPLPFERGPEYGAAQAEIAEPSRLRGVFDDTGVAQAAAAYHGTPLPKSKKFARFSLDKIGTGEGTQARGRGLYFAEALRTAQWYKLLGQRQRVPVPSDVASILEGQDFLGFENAGQAASAVVQHDDYAQRWDVSPEAKVKLDAWREKAKEQTAGSLYEVMLNVEDDQLLDLDKPFEDQPPQVQDAIRRAFEPYVDPESHYKGQSGESIYTTLSWAEGKRLGIGRGETTTASIGQEQEAASKALLAAGIKGAKYLDQMSREFGEGTYNYVIYDDSVIEITGVSEEHTKAVFGTVEKAKDAARLGLKANRVRTLDERGEVVAQAADTMADIRGKELISPQNVRDVMHTVRSPLSENLVPTALDANGRVVYTEVWTSGAINYVNVAGRLSTILPDFAEKAKAVGGVEFVLVHNHPSGETTPSPEDVKFTRAVTKAFAATPALKNLKFERHYIIDNDNVTTITQDGSHERSVVTPPSSSMPDWTDGNYEAKSPQQIIELLGGDARRGAHVTYRDTNGRAIAAVPHSYTELMTAHSWLEAEAKKLGAFDAVFVVGYTEDDWYSSLIESANLHLTERAGREARPVVDVIALDATSGAWKSAATERKLISAVPPPRYQLRAAELVAESGRPMDEAAAQGGLFGGEELVGNEQTSMFSEDTGKQRQNLRQTKITAEEVARLIDERGGPKPVEGETPLDLFGGVAEQTPQYRIDVEEEPRKPDIDAVVAEIKSVPGPATRTKESASKQRARLVGVRDLLDELAERIGRQPRVALGEPFKTQISEVLEKAFTPRQVKQFWDSVLKAKTHVTAYDLTVRARAIMEKQAQNAAIRDLQAIMRKAYKRTQTSGTRPEFLAKIDAVVGDIDFEAMGDKTRASLEATAAYMERENRRLAGTDEEQAAVPGASQVPADVLERMKRLNQTNIRDLTSDEIYEMADVVAMAVRFSELKNRLIRRQRGRTRAEIETQIVEQVQAVPKLKVPRKYTPKGEVPTAPPATPKKMGPIKRMLTGNLLEGEPKRHLLGYLFKEFGTRPEVLMEQLSEKLREILWEDVVIQADEEQGAIAWQFKDGLHQALESVGHPMGTDEFEPWRRQALDLSVPAAIAGNDRTTVQISRDEAISLLGAIKDPSNKKLLARHGFVRDRATTELIKIDDRTIEQLNQITTDVEKKIAQYMHDQFNGPMKDALNKAWVEVFGVDVAKVPNYWPRSIDMTRTFTGRDPLEDITMERDATLASWGHLKKREGAGAPLRIGSALDTYLNHVEHVARLAAYLAPATNAFAILGRPAIKRAMIDRVGEVGYNRILNSIRAQTVKYAETTDGGRIMRRLYRNFGGSVLGLRVSAWLKNPSGLFVSAAYQKDGFTNLLTSFATGFQPSEWARIDALGKKHSPYWRTRYEDDFLHETTSGLIQDRSRQYGKKNITELGLEPLEKSDKFGAVIRFRMAEKHIAKEMPDLVVGSDGYYKEVFLEWKRMMYRGENTSHGGDMTGAIFAGRRNAAVAPFVMFTSSISKIYSLGVRSALQAQKGDVRGATRSAVGTTMALAWAALIAEALVKWRGKDDDEPLFTKIPKRMVKDFASFVPFAGSTISAILSAIMGDSGFRFPGSVTEAWLQDFLNSSVAGLRAAAKAYSGELNARGEKAYREELEKFGWGAAEATAQLLGVPWGGTDLLVLLKKLVPDDPDVQKILRDLQQTEDVSQENRQLLESIRQNDDAAFRRAATDLRKKDRQPTFSDVIAVINRKYGALTKYEPGKAARRELTPEVLQLIDLELEERNELRLTASRMARLNADILKPATPSGPSRGRSTRGRSAQRGRR